ncbi:MAG: VOC family protein [Deltaproteobacteria bacterium]|nr:VOC family protein [Deltaproteobacteria bacterium]
MTTYVVAVKDLDAAAEVWGPFFGKTKPDREYTHEAEGIRVFGYKVGEIYYELIASTREGSEVDRFISRKGEGFMLVSFKVPNTEVAMKGLIDQGYQLIDEYPRVWRQSHYVFVHPELMNGVLVEIID